MSLKGKILFTRKPALRYLYSQTLCARNFNIDLKKKKFNYALFF